jgi:hypothetical protein
LREPLSVGRCPKTKKIVGRKYGTKAQKDGASGVLFLKGGRGGRSAKRFPEIAVIDAGAKPVFNDFSYVRFRDAR